MLLPCRSRIRSLPLAMTGFCAPWGRAKLALVTLALSGWMAGGPTAAAARDGAEELDTSAAVKIVPPDYPYEARRQRLTGTGIVVIEIDSPSGNVKSVRMVESTGHALLDHATIQAFRQWRFRPGTVSLVRTPVTYSMDGPPVFRERGKPASDVLTAFLGKGTVQRGSFPAYPKSVPWTTKSGSGVYEIHVRADGGVGEVRILRSSGDETFDRATQQTLRKWRLNKGPLIIELPLSFTLSPGNYSVTIPRHHKSSSARKVSARR